MLRPTYSWSAMRKACDDQACPSKQQFHLLSVLDSAALCKGDASCATFLPVTPLLCPYTMPRRSSIPSFCPTQQSSVKNAATADLDRVLGRLAARLPSALVVGRMVVLQTQQLDGIRVMRWPASKAVPALRSVSEDFVNMYRRCGRAIPRSVINPGSSLIRTVST
jgi:hypothetical protein